MKKAAIAVLLLVVASFVFADTHTIGGGELTSSNIPFNGLYDYNWSKVIYTKAEINGAELETAASLIGIGFYVGNLPNNYTMADQRVYARHTAMEMYDTTDVGHPNFEDFQLLFQGDLIYNGGGWFYIVFSSLFAWDGSQNIEFLFENWDGDYITGYPAFRYTSTTPNYLAVIKNQDDTFPAGMNGSRNYNRPNIRLITPSITPPDPAILVAPADGAINVSLQPTLSWEHGNIWPEGYYLNLGTDYPPSDVLYLENLSNTLTYTHQTDLETEETYYWQVIPYSDEFGLLDSDDCPIWSFTTHPEGFVTVGNGNQNIRMPLDFYYRNSIYECLYYPNELGFISGTISDIILYNQFNSNIVDTPIKIWLGSTTQPDLSSGYIPASQMSLVFDGTLNFPSGANDILIELDTPYTHTPGNLVMMVLRPRDSSYYSASDYFKCQTVGNNRARNAYSDSVVYDPFNPPAGSLTGQFPKTSFLFTIVELGSISGTVTSGGAPLAGATVTVDGTNLIYTTDDTGTYIFPYVEEGQHQISASKHGYNVVTHSVNVVVNQTVTQDFELTQFPTVTVTGRIVGSDQPTVGLADATISLTGYESYEAITNAQGEFSIIGVYSGHTYNYTAEATDYQNAVGEVVVDETNVDMGDIVVSEMAYPPLHVVATEADDFSNVEVSWVAPDPDSVSEWIYYCGQTYTSIGTDSEADFDVAIRFPASTLASYVGMSLQAVKAWPAAPGNYSIRVWRGGDVSAPEVMEVDQPFTPYLNTYNTVYLNKPVLITGTEDLWFGYRCDVTGGYPAGCDAGPAIDGLGNMMYFQGQWNTLLQLSSSLNYNWCIQGYVGYYPPDQAPEISSLTIDNDRAMTGYLVYRFLVEDQDDEDAWFEVASTDFNTTSCVDNAWAPLPSGVYKYAVKAVYTNNVTSTPVISNEIHKGMIGTLSGIVTDYGTNVPIEGATVTAGEYSGTTNAQGEYSFQVYQGSYTVVCSKEDYQIATQTDVFIVGGQTTNLNFALTEFLLPPVAVEAVEVSSNRVDITWHKPGSGPTLSESFEDYPDFALNFYPWVLVDVDGSGTYGISGYNWPNIYSAMAYMIFNPSATTPPITSFQVHSGQKMAVSIAATSAVNNDWLISPVVIPEEGEYLNFYARSYLADYGLERFKVGVSTGGTSPGDFTIISGTSSVQAPVDWTPFSYNLSSFAGQEIRFGIQCVSNDAFIFMIDDITVGFPPSGKALSASIQTGNPARADNPSLERTRTEVPSLRASMAPGSVFADKTKLIEPQIRNHRAHLGYWVWRLPVGEEDNESAWALLTSEVTADEEWQDTGWGNVPEGEYRWAVKAVYSGNLLSTPEFSSILYKEQHGVTPVVLSSFTAAVTAQNEVKVVWVTQSEHNQLGYRIYRSENSSQDDALLITPVLIPATNTSEEHSYHHVDSEVENAHSYYYWLESVDPVASQFFGPVSVTVSFDVPPVLPEISSLKNAYPNPFKLGTGTNIEIDIKAGETGTLSIYNIQGQVVKTASLAQGSHKLVWNGRDSKGKVCGSGIYFYKLNTPSLNQTKKMILMK